MILEREDMDVTVQARAAGVDCETATLMVDGNLVHGDAQAFEEENPVLVNLVSNNLVAIVYRRGNRVAAMPMNRQLAEQEPLERLIDLAASAAALL